MTKKSDISTPEGYFEDLQQRLKAIPAAAPAREPSKVRRFAPYLAYAASLALLVAVGNFILRKSTTPAVAEDPYWDYIAYLSDALDPDGYWEEDLSPEASLSNEDIVNFLLAENISLEQLVSYEEGY